MIGRLPSPTEQLDQMLYFWRNLNVDTAGLSLDVQLPPKELQGRARLIVVPRFTGHPIDFLTIALSKHMKVREQGMQPRSSIGFWQRESTNRPYAVWVEDSPEPYASEKQGPAFAQILMETPATTLTEELILHLFLCTRVPTTTCGKEVICFCIGSLHRPNADDKGTKVPVVDRRVNDMIINLYDVHSTPRSGVRYGIRHVFKATR